MTIELQNILRAPAAGLNVLVVYDNLISGIKAQELCERLAHRFKQTAPWKLSFWSLSALQHPGLEPAATREATETDLLIVAVNSVTTLPVPIKQWVIESARQLRCHGGAFVAQFQDCRRVTSEAFPAGTCLLPITAEPSLG